MVMSESVLYLRIQEDMKGALRAGEKQRLGTIRLLVAAIKQREIDDRTTLDDNQIVAVIEKMVKQRRDSMKHYEAAGRQELYDQEHSEIEILQTYLPTPLSEAETTALIKEAIAATGASTMQDMGKVMGIIKPQAQGRVDMGKLSAQIKELLSR